MDLILDLRREPNLIDKEHELLYHINRYPDGMNSITFTDLSQFKHLEYLKIYSFFENWSDLEIMIGAVKTLSLILVETHALKAFDRIELYTPYVLGARADRRFTLGEIDYLYSVLMPVFKDHVLKFVTKWTVMDVHNPTALRVACQEESSKINFTKPGSAAINFLSDKRAIKVCPDEGSYYKNASRFSDILRSDKYFTAVESVCSPLYFVKTRKNDSISLELKVPIEAKFLQGTDSSAHVHLNEYIVANPEKYVFVIEDDILDGGRTFVEVASALKEKYPSVPCVLAVTHAIFSSEKMLDSLLESYTKIVYTNSTRQGEENLKNYLLKSTKSAAYADRLVRINIWN